MVDKLYKLNKTPEDIEDLLCKHKKLIYHMLSKYNQLQNQDAESVAWEALWDAINLFDIFSDTKFSTYACTLIKNAILDTIRKQNTADINQHHTELEHLNICYEEANVQYIYEYFGEYLQDKQGTTKNILLAWYSLGFNSTAANIAAMCSCSASYVSRVQNGFRAYMQSRLKEG